MSVTNLVTDPKKARELGENELNMVNTSTDTGGARKEIRNKQIEAVSDAAQKTLLSRLSKHEGDNFLLKVLGGVLGTGTFAAGLVQLALLTSFVYFTTLAIDEVLSGKLIDFLKNNNIGILTTDIKKPIQVPTLKGGKSTKLEDLPEIENPNKICGMIPSIFTPFLRQSDPSTTATEAEFNRAVCQFGAKGTILHIEGSILETTSVEVSPLFINKEAGKQRFHAWRQHIIPFPLCYCPWSSAKTLEEALELEACILLLKKCNGNPGFQIDESVNTVLNSFSIGEAPKLSESGINILLSQLEKDHKLSSLDKTNSLVITLLNKVGEIVLDGETVRTPSNNHFYTTSLELKTHESKINELATLVDADIAAASPTATPPATPPTATPPATPPTVSALKRYNENMKYMEDYQLKTKLNLSIKPGDQTRKLQALQTKIIAKQGELNDSQGDQEQKKKELAMLETEFSNRTKANLEKTEYFYTGDDWSIRWLVKVVVIHKEYATELEFWRLFYLACKLCSTPEATINRKMVNILLKTLVDSYNNPNLNKILTGINRMRITLLEEKIGTLQVVEPQDFKKQMDLMQETVNNVFSELGEQTVKGAPTVKEGGDPTVEELKRQEEDIKRKISEAEQKLKKSSRGIRSLLSPQGGGKLNKTSKTRKKKRNRISRKTKRNRISRKTKRNRKTSKTRKKKRNRKTKRK